MTIGPRPICSECIHSYGGGSCLAFPQGIPDEIYLSDVDHRIPFPGDGGIMFSPIEGSVLTGDPSQEIPWLLIQPGEDEKGEE